MAKTKALEPDRRLSLFDIEAGWIPLIEARIAAETDPELSDERPVCQCCGGSGKLDVRPVTEDYTCTVCNGAGREQSARERAIEAADVALAEHAEKEVEKVDGYYGLIPYLEAAASVRRAEAARNATAARIIERMVESVKAAAVNAILVIPGRTRIEGTRGYLLAKPNGGLAPLLITDESMLPDDVCKLEGSIGAHEYATMLEAARIRFGIWQPATAKFKRVPDNTVIRARLSEPCPECNGQRVRVYPGTPLGETETCRGCGASGMNAVPGARLGERGVHLELK
jgi:hypothetical protein